MLMFTLAYYGQTWELFIDGNDAQLARDIIETYDKGYVIVGSDQNSDVVNFLKKYDVDGNLLWTLKIGGADYYVNTRVIKQTNDGGYVLIGDTNKFDPLRDAFAIRLNSCGELLWFRIFGQFDDFDLANDVVLTDDGGCVVLTNYVGDARISLYKLDVNGEIMWVKNYGQEYNSPTGYSLLVTNDNGLLISGSAYAPYVGSGGGVCTTSTLFKTDSLGVQEWTLAIGQEINSLSRNGFSVEFVDGSIMTLCTFIPWGSEDDDFYLYKVNSEGQLLWHKSIGDTLKVCSADNLVKLNESNVVAIGGTQNFDGSGARLKIYRVDNHGEVLDSLTYEPHTIIGQGLNSTSDEKAIVCGRGYFGQGSMDAYAVRLRDDLTPDYLTNQVFDYDSLCSNMIGDSTIPLDSNYTTSLEDIRLSHFSSLVFPNPAGTYANFKLKGFSDKAFNIAIFDSNGRLIERCNQLKAEEFRLDIESYQNGMYFYLISFEDKISLNGKFVKSEQ